MSDDTKMPFAERVGRLVLFPLAWIDNASQARKKKREEREHAEKMARLREQEAQERELALKRMQEAEAAQKQQEAELEANKGRAERARYRCQLLYDQHEYKIREKFPQEKLERYFQQYMNDDFPVDLVERRGQDLEIMIRGFVDDGHPSKPKSRAEIKEFFDQQRADARSTGLAPEILEATLVEINAREDQAMMDFMDTL